MQYHNIHIHRTGVPSPGQQHLPGESHLRRKGADNKYYVEGRLSVASKDNVKELFNAIVLILKAVGDCRKIILSPLSRYWRGPCCNDSSHHLNYNEPTYLRDLGNAVFWVRDYT
jgi:hypothetical protein